MRHTPPPIRCRAATRTREAGHFVQNEVKKKRLSHARAGGRLGRWARSEELPAVPRARRRKGRRLSLTMRDRGAATRARERGETVASCNSFAARPRARGRGRSLQIHRDLLIGASTRAGGVLCREEIRNIDLFG